MKHGFCATCGCSIFTKTFDWSVGESDFDNPNARINSRLFDDFNFVKV